MIEEKTRKLHRCKLFKQAIIGEQLDLHMANGGYDPGFRKVAAPRLEYITLRGSAIAIQFCPFCGKPIWVEHDQE